MPELSTSHALIKQALDADDIKLLRQAYKTQLAEEGIPLFALLDLVDTDTVRKIKRVTEEYLGEKLHYLNDFYFYTDPRFTTPWHVDTELYAFESAINAWILMEPAQVEDPLAFMTGINTSADDYFHSVEMEDDNCIFIQFCEERIEERALDEVEATREHTPTVEVGDILLLNPRRFHRTNTEQPKHACIIKFIFSEQEGQWLSSKQVPEIMWPEVGVFNRLVGSATEWDSVIEGMRAMLKTPEGREVLTSGLYPDKFPLLREMAQTL